MIDDGDDAQSAITVAEMRVDVQLAKGRRREKAEALLGAVLDAVSMRPPTSGTGRRAGTSRGAQDWQFWLTPVDRWDTRRRLD